MEKYSNREIDMKMQEIHNKLDLILEQTTKHNGRMSKIEGRLSKLERYLLIVGTATSVILFFTYPQLLAFVNTIL